MNKRIAQLARQAGFELNPVHFDHEKFALLIVRECINIVDNLPNGYKDYRNTIENEFREDCINTMKKHFGIEE